MMFHRVVKTAVVIALLSTLSGCWMFMPPGGHGGGGGGCQHEGPGGGGGQGGGGGGQGYNGQR